jgi:hypothetical protein
VTCSTAGARSISLPSEGESAYFVVVPRNAANEGIIRNANEHWPASVENCLPQTPAICGDVSDEAACAD